MATTRRAANLDENESLLLTIWERGECRNMEVETGVYDPFFPEGNSLRAIKAAVRICARCKVWEQCLQYALDTQQPEGIWGGFTPAERRRIVKEEAS